MREKRERLFWNRLRSHFSTKVFARRVENGVSPGDPDVFLMKRSKVIWIELKYSRTPVRITSKLPECSVKIEQVNWHLEYASKGGTSYVLIGTDELDYLIEGKLVECINDASLEEIANMAVLSAKSIGSKLEEFLWAR